MTEKLDKATKCVAMSTLSANQGAPDKRIDLIRKQQCNDLEDNSDSLSMSDRYTTFTKPKHTATSRSSPPSSREHSPAFGRLMGNTDEIIAGIGGTFQGKCFTIQSRPFHVGDGMSDAPQALEGQDAGHHINDACTSNCDCLTPHHSPSVTDCSEDDLDISLEHTAKEALLYWFGVDLTRLARPTQVLSIFESVKEECASILQREGQLSCTDGDQVVDAYYGETSNGRYDAPRSRQRQDHRERRASGGKKRQFQDGNESEDGDENSIPLQPARQPPRPDSKRRKVGQFSCHFRKRNPLRFNVREHPICARKSFADIPNLKKHLCAYHVKNPSNTCERCKHIFGDMAQLVVHLQSCPGSPAESAINRVTDLEDGFGPEIEAILKSRRSADQAAYNDWNSLYKLLFGGSEEPPSSDFEQVIENHDVAYELISQKHSIQTELKDIVQCALTSPDSVTDPAGSLSDRAWALLLGKFTNLLKNSKYCQLDSTTPELDRFALTHSTGLVTAPARGSLEDARCLLDHLSQPVELNAGGHGGVHEQAFDISGVGATPVHLPETDQLDGIQGYMALNNNAGHQGPIQDHLTNMNDPVQPSSAPGAPFPEMKTAKPLPASPPGVGQSQDPDLAGVDIDFNEDCIYQLSALFEMGPPVTFDESSDQRPDWEPPLQDHILDPQDFLEMRHMAGLPFGDTLGQSLAIEELELDDEMINVTSALTSSRRLSLDKEGSRSKYGKFV